MRCVLALVAALLLTAAPAVAQDPPGTALFKTVKEKVGADKPFSLMLTAKVKDGMAEKFETAAMKVAAATAKEKGCQGYEFHRSAEDATTFYLVEKWSSLPALEAHFKTDHLTAFLKDIGDLLDGPPKAVVAKPLAVLVK